MSSLIGKKRSTRGQRMTALVGEALDEDNAFYGAEIWEEGDDSDNSSFNSSDDEEKPDQFDSDFNDSEDDDEDNNAIIIEGDSSKKGQKRARELEREERVAKKNVYKEPTQRNIKRSKLNNSNDHLQERRQVIFDPSQAVSRMVILYERNF